MYIKYVPGQGVEHLVLSTWFPSHIGPPHLGMGLSHFRSLLWKPWPQLELQSDHSDHVDHPPLTVVKDKVGVHFSPGKKNIGIWYYYIGIFLFRRSTSIFGLFDLRSVLQHWVIFNKKNAKNIGKNKFSKRLKNYIVLPILVIFL